MVAIAAAKVAKGGSIKKTSRKRLVDVGRVFSDDKSSNETPTSPAGRSLGLSTAPGVKVDTGQSWRKCSWGFGLNRLGCEDRG